MLQDMLASGGQHQPPSRHNNPPIWEFVFRFVIGSAAGFGPLKTHGDSQKRLEMGVTCKEKVPH